MTKKEALAQFKDLYGNSFVSKTTGKIDKPMRVEEWNNFTDALCKGSSITAKQYHNWSNPF